MAITAWWKSPEGAWEINKGKMPVHGDVLVEALLKGGEKRKTLAGKLNWSLGSGALFPNYEIQYWREVDKVNVNKTVDDIEEGMFIFSGVTIWFCKGIGCTGKVLLIPLNVDPSCTCVQSFPKESFCDDFWSYTYDGKYQPFVPKETEEQKKIRELEETINNAKQLIQELKGNK